MPPPNAQLEGIRSKAKILQDSGATEDEISSYVNAAFDEIGVGKEAPPSKGLSGFVQEHINPIKFPVIQGLEDLGQKIKDTAGQSFKNMASFKMPQLGKFQVGAEAMRTVASKIGETAIQAAPFKPSEFAIAAGAEVLPTFLTPKAIAPKIGKAYIENSVPSTPSEIRHAEKYMGKDAADLVLQRPHLGNSRDDILRNSKEGISQIEKQSGRLLRQGGILKSLFLNGKTTNLRPD